MTRFETQITICQLEEWGGIAFGHARRMIREGRSLLSESSETHWNERMAECGLIPCIRRMMEAAEATLRHGGERHGAEMGLAIEAALRAGYRAQTA